MDTAVTEPVVAMPIERKDGTYALRLCLNQGLLTPGMVQRLMDIIAKYELSGLRATTGQRMNLEGIPKDKLNDVLAEIGTPVEMCPPGVGVCPGAEICKYGIQKTRDVGDRLLALIMANGPYPYKIKSGVSGCRMVCGLSYVRDIGLVGKSKGWEVYFGGGAGRKTRKGVLIGSDMNDDEALAVIEKALIFYRENGGKFERTSGTVTRLGDEALLEAVK